ncbi:MAG: alpha/beta hydrolase [Gammaproteobacteria bacterium]|nr:MAG: alpha/beta hydrolase [Gammaproteobacteria bacterium]
MNQLLLLLFSAVFVYAIVRYRRRLLTEDCTRLNFEAFDGDVMQLGETFVAKRRLTQTPTQSIVCIHGFLEDMRYFTELYQDPSIELILVTNSGYHCPFTTKDLGKPAWERGIPNPHAPYTIEYDAHAFGLAAINLATTSNVRLHGHSRGGAVVLDAVRQRQKELGGCEVVLEAAVLPQAKAFMGRSMRLPKVAEWFTPISLGLVAKVPFYWYAGTVLSPLNRRKKELLPGLWNNAKTQSVVVENIKNMADWGFKTDYSIFDYIKKGTFLIGESDYILDRQTMIDSAERAHSGFDIIYTENSSHFVSLDDPKYARSLAEKAALKPKGKNKQTKAKPKSILPKRGVS